MKIIRTLDTELVSELIEDLNQRLLPLATVEGGVAKGRKHLWLKAQPDYQKKKYKEAHYDPFIWGVIKAMYPPAALAQIYWANGGNGIAWHRDAAFAMPTARILNLGKVLLLSQESNDEDSKPTQLYLKGGELIEFNCKLLHKAEPMENDRIGIAMWKDKIDIKDQENWL